MAWVWHGSKAKGTTRLVALAIADHASDDGKNAWPSVARLAQMCACSEATVRRAIKELQDLGELHVEHQAGGPRDMRDDRRPNRYTMRCPQIVDKYVDGVSGVIPRMDDGVSNPMPRGVTGDTLTVLEPSTSNSHAVNTVQPDDVADDLQRIELARRPLTADEKLLGLEMIARIREKHAQSAPSARRSESTPVVAPDTDDDPIGA